MAFTSDYTEQEPTRAAIDALAGPVLLEFGAPWCGYCLALEPDLKELLAQFPQVRHIRIHDGRGQPLGRSFRVKLWPNLVFMMDSRVVLQAARPSRALVVQGLQAIAPAK